MSGLYWLASYPKSGNTWVRCFLSALAAGGEMPDFSLLGETTWLSAAREWLEVILDISTSDLTRDELAIARRDMHQAVMAAPHFPRYVKVHDRYDPFLFAPEVTAGIVYIVRDPRDVALSYAEHRGACLDDTIEAMRRAIPQFASSLGYRPQVPQALSSWSDHVSSWLDQKDSPVLLLRYEDMSNRPIEEFGRLAAFLGLAPDQGTLCRAVEATRFDALCEKEQSFGFWERSPHMERFFRQGLVGSWQRDLTPAQVERLVLDHNFTMARLGYR